MVTYLHTYGHAVGMMLCGPIMYIAAQHQGIYNTCSTNVRDSWQHKQTLSSGCCPWTWLVYCTDNCTISHT